jgi:hypothetical protein
MAERKQSHRLPLGLHRRFRVTVHGTVFADREVQLERISKGDDLPLIPSLPEEPSPEVWVHLPSGEPVGHLPPEVAELLAPWMWSGGKASSRVVRVSSETTPSWRRLLLEVLCA